MLRKNDVFEMTCESFGQDAQGVCRHEGMAVFVPELLPGERALVRIVKTPEGEICVDTTGKKAGRGAYICPDAACLQRAMKSRALERSFETAIGEDVYAALQAQIGG